jgi:polar amino acid transport system ATP-binding protein
MSDHPLTPPFPTGLEACTDAFLGSLWKLEPKELVSSAHFKHPQLYLGTYGPLVPHVEIGLIGQELARNVVVVTSGVHGVELPAGSALQRSWMRAACDFAAASGSQTRFVFVHALNPMGTALALRTDEKNIDPNRNFLPSFEKLPQTHELFDALQKAVIPDYPSLPRMALSFARLARFICAHGLAPAVAGQYEYPQSLYYGGQEPCWSHKIWTEIVSRHVLTAMPDHVWHVDLHTGYGPYGQMQILHEMHLNGSNKTLLQKLGHEAFLPIHTFPSQGDSVSYWPHLGVCKATGMTLEVGTSHWGGLDTGLIMLARSAKQSAHPQGKNLFLNSERVRRIMRDHFCPPRREWQGKVLADGQRFFKALLNQLTK